MLSSRASSVGPRKHYVLGGKNGRGARRPSKGRKHRYLIYLDTLMVNNMEQKAETINGFDISKFVHLLITPSSGSLSQRVSESQPAAPPVAPSWTEGARPWQECDAADGADAAQWLPCNCEDVCALRAVCVCCLLQLLPCQ